MAAEKIGTRGVNYPDHSCDPLQTKQEISKKKWTEARPRAGGRIQDKVLHAGVPEARLLGS